MLAYRVVGPTDIVSGDYVLLCICSRKVVYILCTSLLQKGHVLRAEFRCRRCGKVTQTWASSRFFGGHYLVNQKSVIFRFIIRKHVCRCVDTYTYMYMYAGVYLGGAGGHSPPLSYSRPSLNFQIFKNVNECMMYNSLFTII